MSEQRSLAAIVSADVAGYSRLMGQDESGTLAALRSHREELWRPKTAEHGGNIVGSAGDSLLTEFPSVVAAVRCAVEIQQAMATRNAALPAERQMLLRIGVNLGEVHAMAHVQRALRLEPDNADSLAIAALAIVLCRGYGLAAPGLDEAVAMAVRAVGLNPNAVSALRLSGWVHVFAAQPETAILHVERALRLSPKDLMSWEAWSCLAYALLQLGRDQEAIVAAQTALQYSPNNVTAWFVRISALALAGRLDEARTAASRLFELRPQFRVSEYRDWNERLNRAAGRRLLDGFRLAGLPE